MATTTTTASRTASAVFQSPGPNQAGGRPNLHGEPGSTWARLSLSTRLSSIAASILLTIMAAFVALDYARERNALLRAKAEQLATVAGSISRILPDGISRMTAEELRSIASTSVGQPIDVCLVQNGTVVLSSGRPALEILAMKTIDRSETYQTWRTPTGLAVSMPSSADVTVEIFVETSLESVNRMLGRTLRLHFIHGLATVFLMTFGVVWVIRTAVHRPIARLLSAMNVMQRGTWVLDVPLSYRDEVGVLTAAFNEMGRKLTRTALEFAHADKLAAVALLSTRLRRQLDPLIHEIDAASGRLTERGLSEREVEVEARRIRGAAALARNFVENVGDLFLAELGGTGAPTIESPGARRSLGSLSRSFASALVRDSHRHVTEGRDE